MKVADLRIGNYVCINNDLIHENRGQIYKVSGLQLRNDYTFPDSTGVVSLENTKSVKPYSQFDEYIEPLPLTEEWLVKFRFECKDTVNGGYIIPINKNIKQYLYCSKRGTYAVIDELIDYKDIVFTPQLQYIHQLQNLYFALTGQELTA